MFPVRPPQLTTTRSPEGSPDRSTRPSIPGSRRQRRAWFLAAALVLSALALTSCSDGSDLSASGASPVGAQDPASPPVDQTGPFRLEAPAIPAGGSFPAEHTCDGPSPELVWPGAKPAGTVELALALRDTTTDTPLWFVASINSGETRSPKGGTPQNVAQLPQADGKLEYSGPCPPAGETHTYEFTVFALSAPAVLPGGTTANDAPGLIQPKVVGTATLTATATGAAAAADPASSAPTSAP